MLQGRRAKSEWIAFTATEIVGCSAHTIDRRQCEGVTERRNEADRKLPSLNRAVGRDALRYLT